MSKGRSRGVRFHREPSLTRDRVQYYQCGIGEKRHSEGGHSEGGHSEGGAAKGEPHSALLIYMQRASV
jgi:hypothetical protein